MISIVIPYFNKSSTIDNTLSSLNLALMKDKFIPHEIVIINDGSFSQEQYLLVKICEKYNSLCINIVHQKNMGVSAARNNGVKICKYSYVYFLDADDTVDNCFFQSIKKIKAVNNNHHIFNLKVNNKIMKHAFNGVYKSDDVLFSKLMQKRCLHLSNFIFTRSDIASFDTNIKIGEDLLFIYESIRNKIVEFHDEIIATYLYDGKFHASENNGMTIILDKMTDEKSRTIIQASLNDRNYLSSCFFGYNVEYSYSLLSKKIKIIGFFKSPLLYSMMQKIRFYF